MIAMPLVAIALVLALACCSDLGRVCEDIEPFRPLIRGAVTAVEPAAAIPFAFTRQVHCADLDAVSERLRDQR